MNQIDIKQFEIYMVDLNPIRGSEQMGIRPCLVMEGNATADVGSTVIALPITSKKLERIYPYEVLVYKSKINGLTVDSKILGNQIRVLDKTRFLKKLGSLEKLYYEKVYKCIKNILDLNGDFRD